jgi:hypothetical protein
VPIHPEVTGAMEPFKIDKKDQKRCRLDKKGKKVGNHGRERHDQPGKIDFIEQTGVIDKNGRVGVEVGGKIAPA